MSENYRIEKIAGHEIQIRRSTGGVIELKARNHLELSTALGFAHAQDRMTQMALVRLAGQGRLSECLKHSENTQEVDIFMREMGFAREAKQEVKNLSKEARDSVQAYCDGVNHFFEHHSLPFEFKLVGYQPEKWCIEDCLITVKLMGYVGLAQTQQDAEKLIVRCLRDHVDTEKLRSLFSPFLEGLSEETIEIIRQLNIYRPVIPEHIKLLSALPKILASNNWVLAPERSESGNALQCNDPHLEVNRLPAVWYEMIAHGEDDFQMGVTMPGVPGMIMGRNRSISYGFTYGFMDMIDYFIEDVRDGKFRRHNRQTGSDEFIDFDVRNEVILRKKLDPLHLKVLENHHGILEHNPLETTLADGYYLCRAYSGSGGTCESLEALARIGCAQTTEEAQSLLKKVSISANWIIADVDGSIVYQQSGRLPKRVHLGLYPLEGWDPDNDWDGVHDPDALAHINNPPEGFLVTANEDRNQVGKPLSINLCMADYRAQRITRLLQKKRKHNLQDMQMIQRDLYSIQAERFMVILKSEIPDTPVGKILKDWDLRYNKESQGAYIFETIVADIMRHVFGKGMFGLEAWDLIKSETSSIVDFFTIFDRIMLDPDLEHSSLWYGLEDRQVLFAGIMKESLEKLEGSKIPAWGDVRQIMMKNLFFDGILPQFMGFDYGPIMIEGNRATVVQGSMYEMPGKESAFCPSYRYITDLGTQEIHTVLAGGPSDRRFSKHYKTDIENWLNFKYKVLKV
jgi:penicillin G amidase